ncbi:MAG: BlaI/MecI/CopY family transcriptional regulator [Acidobacteriota bacterium]
MKKDLDKIILTPHELEVMKIVWEMGAASVKNVHVILSKRKKVAYTTILTIMGILETKGVLTHTKSGRAFIYRPLLLKKQAMRNQLVDVVERFFDGNPQKLIESIQRDFITGLKYKEKDTEKNIKVIL